MALYAATIFLSAFLLFLVQPIVAKEILPWFGGSAAVWTTCLVFFQAALLGGYAYADVLVRHLRPSRALIVHLVLLAVACTVLPIVPAAHWKPAGDEQPIWRILGLLAATIGPPYFLLSSTSPLVQAWIAQRFDGRNPYRLFALSNLASLLALVAYPFVIEPRWSTRLQASAWSWGFAGFAAVCAIAAVATLRTRAAPLRSASMLQGAGGHPSMPGGPGDRAMLARESIGRASRLAAPGRARQWLWFSLAATASLLLLAVTGHIAENIAAVPLLWILPLSIYLVTFILSFDASRWYRRPWFVIGAALLLGAMAWTLADDRLTHELRVQVGVCCAGLFAACMFCHGELASTRPAPRYLTRFYLMVALGGAGGSTLVGIVAPIVLPANFELPIGLALCALLLVLRTRDDGTVYRVFANVALMLALGSAIVTVHAFYTSTIYAARNFYGVLRVQEVGEGEFARRLLIHGTILHGNQYLAPRLSREPTTYYTRTSGIGVLLETLNPRLAPMKVGMIGLGAGTLATYGAKGDIFRIYDINPAALDIARRYFTYLGDSDATIETPLGDARLNLEREPAQQFDVLAIDAFSSDAIPVHLITSEALSVYTRHMKPGGVIAFHVTNRFVDLAPVVAALADAHHLHAVLMADEGDNLTLASRSDWVLLAPDMDILGRSAIAARSTPIQRHPQWRLWTDDFNNIWQVIKR